jgi:hypothetical protein
MDVMDEIDHLSRKAHASGDYRDLAALYRAAVNQADYETAQHVIDGMSGVRRATSDRSFQADMAQRQAKHEATRARVGRLANAAGKLKALYGA